MTEGERDTFGLTKYYFFEKYYYAGSFHHFVVPLPPGGRLFCVRSHEGIIVSVYCLSRDVVGALHSPRCHLERRERKQ